jgi:Protein of unknown function (DUF3349)
MVNPHVVAKIVNFFRAGYPEGVPPRDYFPALALLKLLGHHADSRNRHSGSDH